MPNYSQLTYSNLVKIETLLAEGFKAPDVAIRIGKHKTTVYRCIANNSENDEPFNAESAWQKIRERKSTTNVHPRIVSESLLAKYLVEKIESYWSPEQIAGRWHEDTGEALAHETVYQYIYQKEPQLVKLYFRRKGKKYQHDRKAKYQILDRRMIDDRPKHIGLRKEFGHWEGDTIVGKDHQGAITTNVERKGGFLLASKVEQPNAQNTADMIIEDFQELPESLRLSVTFDNGREFARHKTIEELAKITVYFAHAYSPWERGSNENTNGLLRQFIPKSTDFSTISAEDLAHYVSLINNRPRKRLNYKTPYEVLQEELAQVALDSRM